MLATCKAERVSQMSRGGHLGSSIYELEPELREISLHLLAGFVLFVEYISRNLRQFVV